MATDKQPLTLLLRCVLVAAFCASLFSCASFESEPNVIETTQASNNKIPLILRAGGDAVTYLPDFSYAGYGFGAIPIPGPMGQRLVVTDFGAIANDSLDDTAAIQRALAAAHQVQGAVTVVFPAGKFLLSDMLEITRGNIAMTGAGDGAQGTILSFTKPLSETGDGGRLDELREYLKRFDKLVEDKSTGEKTVFSEYSWTGGLIWVGRPEVRETPYLVELDVATPITARSINGSRGDRALTLDSTKGLREGQWIQVLWFNTGGENGPLLRTMYGEQALARVGSHHWNFPQRPIVRQLTKVIAIQDQVVVLGDPLLHNVTPATPVAVAEWQPLENVGFEHFKLEFPNAEYLAHHREWGFNGIHMGGVANGWARNLTFVNAESAILTYNSASITYADITTRGDARAHYAVHIGSAHNVLAERITTYNKVQHSLTVNTLSTRAVYKDAEVFDWPSLDQHGGANHQNLFDNVTIHVSPELSGSEYKADIFRSGGAKYWLPQHGLFNTIWNLKVIVDESVPATKTVDLFTLDKNFYGPGAHLIGVHGNRSLKLSYQPTPYTESLNTPITAVPSLYEYQLQQRLKNQ